MYHDAKITFTSLCSKQPANRYSNLPIAGFIERLNGGKTIITAEGYLMELDRRG